MENKKVLQDYNMEEIKELMKKYSVPAFRAKQLFEGMICYKPIQDMQSLPKDLKDKLDEEYSSQPVLIHKKYVSKDGTIKYLFSLSDNNLIEGVFMKYSYGNTLCISTQVGCRMGCSFCASTLDGLVRNLSAGEMLGEVLAVNKDNLGDKTNRKVTNIVLMGSGEPLDNYDNTIKFLRNVSSPDGLCVSPRNISLSTCGLLNKISMLKNEHLDITLTISLHSAIDEKRRKMMKVSNGYTLAELIEVLRDYQKENKRRIVFEYILTRDNTSEADVLALKNLTKGLLCHINLIPLNDTENVIKNSITRGMAERFLEKLIDNGLSATIRRTLGEDIEGACGQLKRRYLSQVTDND
ncbi:MAG: 23S rRNA (adenine(2503)-C(2))-methyltransferase RlmN [Clostridia bacterium]